MKRDVYKRQTEVYLTCEENIILHGGVVCSRGIKSVSYTHLDVYKRQVSDHILTGEVTTAEERQNTFTAMMEIALDTAAELD